MMRWTCSIRDAGPEEVNWVLDLDITAFFDSLSQKWLVQFLEHRIADRRVVRLIQKWLNAGVLEDGQWIAQEEGTPQGGSVSPLLANLYLHYVFDLWAQVWRRKMAPGEMILVRYADDIVVGFQQKAEADRFWAELTERMAKFHLELHPEKTRLLEFGRLRSRTEVAWRRETGDVNFRDSPTAWDDSQGTVHVLRQTIRKGCRRSCTR